MSPAGTPVNLFRLDRDCARVCGMHLDQFESTNVCLPGFLEFINTGDLRDVALVRV